MKFELRGSEYLVNTQTYGFQYYPSITGLTNGGFVITWNDGSGTLGDSSYTSIKAQVFNASGAKIGSEFLVNTQTVGDQFAPTVTELTNGGFVVTWVDVANVVGISDANIKAQVFDWVGAKVGGEIAVNTQTVSNQYHPSITGLTNGGFVVTWYDTSTTGDGDRTSIKAQVFDASGAKVGGEFLVNTQTAGDQHMPTVAALTNGGFVVTWYEDATPDGGGDIDIKAQIFDVAGTKVGGEFLVNTYQASWYPTITGLTNGGFVITWNDGSGTLGDSSYSSIKAQVFDASAAKIGGEFLVNTYTTNEQSSPTIAALTNGGFVVTWYDGSGTLGDADGSSIKAQVFDAVGTKIGSEFLVNTQTAANQFYPTVAALTNGGFVVTWWDLSGTLGDGSYSSIKAQVFAVVNDAPTGTPTAVLANGTEDVAYTVTAADLLAGFSDADGDVLAVANLAASIGSVVDNGNGSFTITQAADFNGAVTLTYDVTDGHGGTLAGQTLGYTVTAVNDAPTLAISNAVTTLAEGTYANAVQVADITITDDGEGSNNLTLSGADAALFEIVGTELFLKAGTVLDFEGGNAMLDVTVEVDDPLVGGSPEDSEALSISVTDVNEAITNGNGGGTLAGTAGNDLIDGQGGNDSINAGAGNDTIIGGPGRDNVNAGNGDDTIVATIGDGSLDVYGGGAGIDTLDMSGITAPARVNLALSFVSSSQTGLDVLASIENAIGGSGNDVITGNGVANRLDGQGGNDTISAGSGNDIIIGGTGNDTMNGGPGSDTSIFVPGFGNDRVIQFDANPAVGQDRLDISAFGITNADFAARVTIADVGADTLVTIDADAGQTIRLVGIGDAGTVTQADFLL